MDRAIEELKIIVPTWSDQELVDMFVYFNAPDGSTLSTDNEAIIKLLSDEIERRGLNV